MCLVEFPHLTMQCQRLESFGNKASIGIFTIYNLNEKILSLSPTVFQMPLELICILEDLHFEKLVQCEQNGCSSIYGPFHVYEGSVPGQQHLQGRIVQMVCDLDHPCYFKVHLHCYILVH